MSRTKLSRLLGGSDFQIPPEELRRVYFTWLRDAHRTTNPEHFRRLSMGIERARPYVFGVKTERKEVS